MNNLEKKNIEHVSDNNVILSPLVLAKSSLDLLYADDRIGILSTCEKRFKSSRNTDM